VSYVHLTRTKTLKCVSSSTPYINPHPSRSRRTHSNTHFQRSSMKCPSPSPAPNSQPPTHPLSTKIEQRARSKAPIAELPASGSHSLPHLPSIPYSPHPVALPSREQKREKHQGMSKHKKTVPPEASRSPQMRRGQFAKLCTPHNSEHTRVRSRIDYPIVKPHPVPVIPLIICIYLPPIILFVNVVNHFSSSPVHRCSCS
jgi:hypothetical protein